MSNDYFNADTVIARFSRGASAVVNGIFQSIASGFDLLPGREALNQNRVTYYTAGGTANALTVTMDPVLTSYLSGLDLRVKITANNTGACTLNVNGLGARSIKLTDGTNPAASDIKSGDVAHLIYDGTNFILQSVPRSFMSGITSNLGLDLAFTGNPTFSGNPVFTGAPNFNDISNKSTVRSHLGLAIGSNVQAFDAGLASIAGLTTAADRMIYTTGSDAYAVATLTAAGRALLDDASASAQRTTLGLAIGSDVQAFSSNLTTFASNPLTSGELGQLQNINSVTISNAQWGYLGATTAFGASLMDDASASAGRTTLGLGTMATQNSGSVTITGGSISGITALNIGVGGTGATTASAARTNLGLGTIATLNSSGTTLTGLTTVARLSTGAVNSNTNTSISLDGFGVISSESSLSYNVPTGSQHSFRVGATSHTGGNAGSTPIMRVDGDGVQIGTSSAIQDSALTVKGTMNGNASVASGGAAGIMLEDELGNNSYLSINDSGDFCLGTIETNREVIVGDGNGNLTTISPHQFPLIPGGPSEDMAWAYLSRRGTKTINVDILAVIRAVETLTGQTFVYQEDTAE